MMQMKTRSKRRMAYYLILGPLLVALGASATEPRQTGTCQQLLALSTTRLPLGPDAASFLQLVQLGLDNVPPVERSRSQQDLQQALTLPFATNPFANLSSYQGQAFARQIEELTGHIGSDEWSALKIELDAYLDNHQNHSDQRTSDARQTQAVKEFQFLSFDEITESYQPSWHFKATKLTGWRFLGQTSGGHLIFRFHSLSAIGGDGIASIASHAEAGRLPRIVWIRRRDPNIYATTAGGQGSDMMNIDLERLSGQDFSKFWVLNQRLYAQQVLSGSSEAELVEIDPASGSITDRIPLPATGSFRFLKVAGNQIVAGRFVQSPEFVVHEIYRFNQEERRFIETGLNLAALNINILSLMGEPEAERLEATSRHFDVSLATENINTPIEIERKGAAGHSSFDPNSSLPLKPWSSSHGYKTSQKKSGFIANKIIVSVHPTVVRASIDESMRLNPNIIAKMGKNILYAPEFTLNYSSSSRGEDIHVLQLPAISKNLIYLPARFGIGLGDMWLVDRETLEVQEIQAPHEEVKRQEDKYGGQFTTWRTLVNPAGQAVLVGFNDAAERSVSWVLNTKARRFDQPLAGPLPKIDKQWPDARSKWNAFIFSDDQRSVVGETTGTGIWLLLDQRLSRAGDK